MTVPNQIATITQDGNGVTTVWDYPFLIPEAGDVAVTVTDTTVTPNVSTNIPSSLYTISGVGNSNGGTVTYPLVGSPIATGFTITIARSLLIVQDTSIENQGDFYPLAVEGALDYLTMLIQDQQAEIDALTLLVEGGSSTPTINPTARVVPTSGTASITLSVSDSFGLVIIDQTTTASTTVFLPAASGPYTIMDGGGNFGTYPVAIKTAVGTIFSNGNSGSDTTSWMMYFGGEANTFTYAGGKMWVR